MGSDLKALKSHPDKFLLDHIQGVQENVKQLTNSKIAELVAVFHDLGKINPNFQAKVDHKKPKGYANHSYLSAYTFFCAFGFSPENQKILHNFLSKDTFSGNDIIALIVLIARHHGNLPDFYPKKNEYGTGTSILSENENFSLFHFLDKENDILVEEFISYFGKINEFKSLLKNKKVQEVFLNKLIFKTNENVKALDFFLDYQFAFASVIQADKADAGKIGNVIIKQKNEVLEFSIIFTPQLNAYLNLLKQDTELNKLRTAIRQNAVKNIQERLNEGECVFELTAPTGSGKTLMMLSLASEILKTKGAKRIIYALPFLSITEQVETEVMKIFRGYERFIQRIDSKSENFRFEKIQKELDNNPTEENIAEINILEFQENTFAYPFIITTFVRFFETLLSNKNAELLKLPNFSNCIFLLDEIQSLPPRLYGFFVAYLKKFCQKFNSYGIISTATQPNFILPDENDQAKQFFFDYTVPKPLLSLEYFNNKLFNRYHIQFNNTAIDLELLSNMVIKENTSLLVILNTIDDTKELYEKLLEHYTVEELLLLNTHFTPRDRKIKIYLAKRRLRENKRVIVISTQLIEAGVDIDFPVLYRDFATVSSIIQSAGRCNRNGKLNSLGKVKLFVLQKNGKTRSSIIYQGKDKDILTFTQRAFSSTDYDEKDLLQVQQRFFSEIQSKLLFARHSQNSPTLEFDFLKDIAECMYEKIGKFRLIDKQFYGEEIQYYVQHNEKDFEFEKLLVLHKQLVDLFRSNADIPIIKRKKKVIEIQLNKMSNQIIQIRLKKHHIVPMLGNSKNYFNIYKIDTNCYSFARGIDLKGSEFIL